MLELFKQIIVEFHQSKLPEPIMREIVWPSLPANVRKARVCIGMRRSGKTWCLYQRMQVLLNQGVDKCRLVYINFEDERLSGMTDQDLQSILQAYWQLYPQYIDSELYFFLDEIAEVPGWEQFVRRLLDNESIQLYLSGSSAKMLSKEIASNLRGRTLVREVFPLSFSEYLQAHDQGHLMNQAVLTTKQHALVQSYIERYLKWGGFPETLSVEPALHREILQDYMNSVIYRDVIERYDVTNHVALRQLLLYCLQNPACWLSVNKLFNQFKSQGIKVSKNALYEYLVYLEDAYGLLRVPVFSLSLNKTQLKPKKIYPIDPGVITAYAVHPDYTHASSLETAVFLHLRRQQPSAIYYYQTQDNQEVDFLTVEANGVKALYQVSLSIKHDDTYYREISALQQAMHELELNHATLITLNESQQVTLENGVIDIKPVQDLFLA